MRSCPGLCLAQLTISFAPLIGVTLMPFLPGCHRPFRRSYRLRSLPLLSQDCVLSSFGSVSFASAIPDLCFSISSLHQSSLSDPSPRNFNCWCLQRQSIVTPRCRWWFRGTHPSWCCVDGGGFEPHAHLSSFGESPTLWKAAVALSPSVCEALTIPLFPTLPVCFLLFRLFHPFLSRMPQGHCSLISLSLPSLMSLLILCFG